MTTGQAIREFCKECVNSNFKKDRENCGGEYVLATKKPCPLFKNRLKGKGSIRTIRKNCLECMGNSSFAVEECTTKDCKLYEFRLGRFLLKRKAFQPVAFVQNRFKPKARVTVRGKQP